MRMSLREIICKGLKSRHEDYLYALEETITLRDNLLKLIAGKNLTHKSNYLCS